ncbi:MAG TPA: glycoside hydrolase family 2 TIM barrel-domain containing protein [Baekduia sp.]|uniref:glycoside hydrolase family 2 TIM barrel-domain containing protein n=1 Tax=Baekduia sp. TaxID=2600305 RepID=UPI002CD41817|nr:glycoside hydrolase family 2 TIM barrel-domain containing protein [Baekduia sp.]HMJ33895.1 glycoside hydrolase family 2 TIM barrel-domain containing protein [Baekduia sp.]
MTPALVRRVAALLTTTALICAAAAGTAAAAPAPPRAVDLDAAGWQYAADPGDRGLRDRWSQSQGRPPWQPVTLPHVFDPHPDDATFTGATGWYRIALTAPRGTPAGFGWGVRFEQVRRDAQVWLDGKRLAVHRDPYAPFTVALPALANGGRHELVVRADSHKGREPREGWWNWGGITRPAQLVPLGALVTRDAGFLPRRQCDADGQACRWSVLVDATVENRGAITVRPRLAARLSDPDGRPAGAGATTARPLAPGERARVRFAVPVDGDAQLWAPGHAELYGAALDTIAPSGVQQTDRARIGLRTIGVRDGLLQLNGKPIELRGASIQEDVDGHGPALTDADVAGIVAQLKTVGANVTRAHYALDERLQRGLDEAGILVWSQAPVYHRDANLVTRAQRDEALSTVRAAVLATRNHPSTITHSVANELSVIPDQVPGTAAFLRDARALTVDLDPTLPTAVDTLSYPGFPRQEAYAAFDLLGINSYFGWYPGKPGHSTADIRSLAPYLRGMRAMYPSAGLVLTEFGAEATMTGPANEKETYAFQDVYTRDVLNVVGSSPTLSGAIYWTLREFAVKPKWDGGAQRGGVERDAIHNKGLVTYDGRTKPAWNALRDDIRKTPLVRGDADVAYALNTRVAVHDRGRIGGGVAIGILAALLVLLAVDVWAFLGWRGAILADDRETRDRRRRGAIAAVPAGDVAEPAAALRSVA